MGALFAGMFLTPCSTPDPAQGPRPPRTCTLAPSANPVSANPRLDSKSSSACTTEFLMDNGVGSTMTVGRVKPIARKFDRPRQDLNASGFLTSVIGAAWGRKDHKPTGLPSAPRDTRPGGPHPGVAPRFAAVRCDPE